MKLISTLGLIICLILPIGIYAQCGAVGNNLFQQGDFGEGVLNNMIEDPSIAPGYNYVTQGPPNDGDYIITKNTGNWSGLWGTWLELEDNSMNPDGYMMVVNASFDPGLFYEEVVTNLCENTTFEFTADIINMIMSGVNDHSDPNVDFLIDGEVVLRTGNIPKNETWNTYSFEFSTAPGQDSVTLALRNNAPGGIGNDLALDNIAFRACGPNAVIQSTDVVDSLACSESAPIQLQALLNGIEDISQAYIWETSTTPEVLGSWERIEEENGARLELGQLVPGVKYYRFGTSGTPANIQNANCIFYSDPFIVEVPQRLFELSDTLCGGLPLPFEEGELVRPGLFQLDLISAIGCDSIVMIQLDTIQRAIIEASLIPTDAICGGQASGSIRAENISNGYSPYTIEVNGTPYTSTIAEGLRSGDYDVRIVDRYGCFFSGITSLNEPPDLEIDLGPDIEIILGEQVMINAISNLPLESITWSGIQDTSDAFTLDFIPLSSGRIEATGFTTDGCTDTDDVIITVDTEARIYIPNAFSPNGDMNNDEYYISPFGRSLGGIESFIIFDRWGNMVWETNDAEGRWDGTFKGQEVAEGLYPYFLKAFLINGESIERKGSLHLIR